VNIVPTHKTQDFINSLDKPSIQKVAKMVDLLDKFGNKLGMPHSKYISHNLFELRIRGKQEIRIFYCFSDNNAFLLHGFIKKSQKTPNREIELAARVRNSIDI